MGRIGVTQTLTQIGNGPVSGKCERHSRKLSHFGATEIWRCLMKLALTTMTALLWADGALAHVGHLAEVAGHGHWLGAAAIGAAIALGAWAAAKGKKDGDSVDDDAEHEEELQEA